VTERNLKRTKEFKIGDIVPILEHLCPAAGSRGKVTEINQNGVLVSAICTKCGKSVAVDIKELKLSK
jgi:transcription elongation factor Elf1